ncbi:DUF4976 domain-containing protein [Puteibacter caeruleilacunae]|nr:DUF4976 domain-containing protein [Puteibacter caeruleilacunae]
MYSNFLNIQRSKNLKQMKRLNTIILCLIFLTPLHHIMAQINVIPKVNSIVSHQGTSTITNKGFIVYNDHSPEMQDVVNNLSTHLKAFYHLQLKTKQHTKTEENCIILKIDTSIETGEEGYLLEINNNNIKIAANTHAGLFYGVQSLKQMMPNHKTSLKHLIFPNLLIKDHPRFSWRGAHLDVGRYFFSADDVCRFIDQLAMHKINVFHWHLVEDQGWRVEIDRYPRLAEIASQRKETIKGHNNKSNEYDGKPHGGYYKKDEIKRVVAYAKSRFIEVIPEIEMPGHTQSVLAAYPEVGCTGGPYEVATRWSSKKEVYCAGSEKTFEFIQNVLDEIIPLFPSQYIHIGGDECKKDRWKACPKCQQRIKDEHLADEDELQSYFIQRIEKYLNSKRKKIIGWDEILEGGLAPNATVMSWRGTKGGIAAAKEKHNVIMTPGSHCYFDKYQTKSRKNEPLSIGGYVPIDKVYSFEPVPQELSPDERKYILGTQACLWSEYIPDMQTLEFKAYPRMAALAEVMWTDPKHKDYHDFKQRLSNLTKIYQSLKINYCDFSVEQRPNIVFILADDMGTGQVGCYGTDYYQTPNIDRIAKDGMRFNNAYAAAAICSPTRASIMTGKYPARLNLTDYIPGKVSDKDMFRTPDWQQYLPLEEKTFAELMSENGYTTALFGKWHLSKAKRPPISLSHNPDKQGFKETFITYKPAGKLAKWQNPEIDAHNADTITNRSIDFIKRNKNQPFFLMVSHNAIHDPLMAKSKLVEKYNNHPLADKPENNATIAAMVETMDSSIGRILDEIKAQGIEDNTIVVFFADNGGKHKYAEQKPFRSGKGWLYEGGIREPLIINWPGSGNNGTICNDIVSSIDFFPTFIEMAKLHKSSSIKIDGTSLVKLMKGEHLSRETLFWHYPHYHTGSGMRPASAMRKGNYKLILWYEQQLMNRKDSAELYDLSNDIAEQHNLVHEKPELANKLIKELYQWKKKIGAQMPTLKK